eukprot:10679801-Alexandrium_andersonii.AAC.1
MEEAPSWPSEKGSAAACKAHAAPAPQLARRARPRLVVGDRAPSPRSENASMAECRSDRVVRP